MSTRKPRKKAEPRKLTMWDEGYFDATFTNEERHTLRKRLMEICGYGPETDRLGIHDYIGFDYQIEQPAQDKVYGRFVADGFEYKRDRDRLDDYALIHISRELGYAYKSFAKNVPKIPLDGFIQAAKRAFPDFRRPRNDIERTIQEHKLHTFWCDWHEASEHHWIDFDRFEKRDYPAILEQIAQYNETRPKLIASAAMQEPERKPVARKVRQKFAPLKLVHSRDGALS